MIVAITGPLAFVLATVGVWPQAWRAWRHSTEGVAWASVMIMLSTCALWTGYTYREADFFGLIATLSILAAAAGTMAALWKDRRLSVPQTGAVIGAVLTCSAAAVALPVLTVGVAAMLFGIAAAIPQAVRMWRSRDVEGVSAASWSLLAGENITWIVYGSATGHWVYIPAAVVYTVAGGYIAMTATRAHHRRVETTDEAHVETKAA